MRGLLVRPERVTDADAVRVVHDAAFGQPDEGRLVDALRRDSGFGAALSLVAEGANGAIVGHVLFSPIFIEGGAKPTDCLALAPLAVLPRQQNQGIGSPLATEGLERARAAGHAAVIVLGEPEYYARFGFRPAADWGIRPPFEVPPGVFQAIELAPDALAEAAGTVRYPPAFSDL